MADRIIDIADEIRTFLDGKISVPIARIFLEDFAHDAALPGLMIRREDTLALTQDLPVDFSRVKFVARGDGPDDTFSLAKEVIDLLHGIDPQAIGGSRILSFSLESGPTRNDDDEVDKPQHFFFFLCRVKC